MEMQANRRLRLLCCLAVIVVAVATANAIAGVIAGSYHDKGLLSDFTHFWLAARMAVAGHAAQVYDPVVFARELAGTFDERVLGLFWLYPPHAFWLYVPFAVDNYGAAYVAFMVASFAALMASLAVTGRVTPGLALCLAVSPAVTVAAVFGQNGL